MLSNGMMEVLQIVSFVQHNLQFKKCILNDLIVIYFIHLKIPRPDFSWISLQKI